MRLFEEAGVHLVWCFENEKKGLSYIWKCPGNEQRVKKITSECCLFNSKRALLFYGPFLFFGFPGEIQIKRFEIYQVERLNMSRVWITEARSSSCSLIFWLEHFTNERRHSWLLLIPQTAGTSVSLQGVQSISPHRTSVRKPFISKTDATNLTKFPNSSFQ